jgi:hypothetical protein
MAASRGGAFGGNVAAEPARAGARSCRREAARRAPQVLRRSGRTTAVFTPRAHHARAVSQPARHQAAQPSCILAERSRHRRPGALRAPLKT